ncbi:MAG: twin-arginine translocation signal domain-containing protein, partial [Bacteroidales bacterium]|nr:twin-arginine translocation signal domain-containing protein [Bacteroidales bacterium]
MKNLDRRNFIKTVGIGGAGLTFSSASAGNNYFPGSADASSEEDFFPVMPWDEPAVEDAKTPDII